MLEFAFCELVFIVLIDLKVRCYLFFVFSCYLVGGNYFFGVVISFDVRRDGWEMWVYLFIWGVFSSCFFLSFLRVVVVFLDGVFRVLLLGVDYFFFF